jgi:hypothetical protein
VSSPVSDSDKFKALNVQLRSVLLNVIYILGLITLLVDMVNKIRESVDLNLQRRN